MIGFLDLTVLLDFFTLTRPAFEPDLLYLSKPPIFVAEALERLMAVA